MRDRLVKLCDGFDGKRFEMPKGGIQHSLIQTQTEIKDLKAMINLTDKELSSYLSNLNNMERSTVIVGGNQNYGGSSRLEIYEMLVRHELKIFSNLIFM